MIIHGDCLDVMKDMEADSIDSIVTDPPYGLSFMGKDWDHGIPGVRFWEEALMVAKPGAHLLAFGGTRTFHRLAVAIEDAGWEIRDTVGWIYGSGFPKSHNVGKAIDKVAGAKRQKIGRVKGRGSNSGEGRYNWNNPDDTVDRTWYDKTAPATEAAKQWDGWGTALKPAWEPVIVARKPFKGTVAGNVLEHGTGAINIDGCRVSVASDDKNHRINPSAGNKGANSIFGAGGREGNLQAKGRWPANIIQDGSDDVLEVFPETKGGGKKDAKYQGKHEWWNYLGDAKVGTQASEHYGSKGSAARFFYCAKASKRERGENNKHPTVKPVALMRYLCRLVTPPDGIVFDPFMGSGSTGVAAIQEGFEFIGCDIESEYVEIAKKRIEHASKENIQLRMRV